MTGDVVCGGQADMEPCGCPHTCGQSGQWFSVPVTTACPLPTCPTPLDEPLPLGDMSPLQLGADREQERENKMDRSCFPTPPSSPEQDSSIGERREIKRKELANKKET